VLSPHGHVEHHLHVVDDGTTTWLHVEPGTAPALVAFLDSMRFMLRVEVADVTAEHAVVWTAGGFRVVPRADLVAAVTEVGEPAGVAAYDALRVAAGVPRLGVDTDHRTIPNELSWLADAVHLEKGCYRGQETVARVHNLGRPPRRLVLLHLDGVSEELPRPGTPVLAGTREVGRAGSVVRHHELGVVALALVKQSVQPGTALTVGGSAASIDPDDVPAGLDEERAAARDRIRAVRSATIRE
jgi:folate-binding protein YgfZ